MSGHMMSFRVNKLILVETPGYNNMVTRPYEATMDGYAINQAKEVMQYGRYTDVGHIGKVATSLIRPSGSEMEASTITEGWGSSRLRFLLEIDLFSEVGPTTRKIIQGYTSHVGVNFFTKTIDHQMHLYFNNVITLRRSVYYTPHGEQERWSIAEADQILMGTADFNFNGSSTVTKTLRPEDIFVSASHSGAGGDVLDMTTGFYASPIKRNNRKNNIPSNYLSSVMKGYQSAFSNNGFSDNLETSNAFDTAAGYLVENSVSSDQFFSRLLMNTSSFNEGGFVTYGELLSLSPEIDSNAIIVPLRNVMEDPNQQFNPIHGGGEHWQGSNNETLWASILLQALPGLMMDSFITRIAFRATNEERAHDAVLGHVMRIVNVDSFTPGVDMTPFIETFRMRAIAEIIGGLTTNNTINYILEASIDLVGETRLKISVLSGPYFEFVAPSFADGRFTSVITHNQDHEQRLAYDLTTLCGDLDVGNPAVNNTFTGETDYGF